MTLQALVTCLYTGNIPAGASLYHLTEAARLLKMDELSAVLQKTFIAQGGSLLELARSQPIVRSTGYSSQGPAPHAEPRPEKSGKKIRSNRLDQILYQKLNVNHLAPSDIPEPRLVPPPESSRVPPLDLPRVPPPDPRGGILGELLTKADPLRSVFSAGGYSIADLGFDSSSTPLNLSKPHKSQSSSTSAEICSSYTPSYTSPINSSTSTTSPCNLTASSLASSLASQPDLNLSGLTSLAPTMPGTMSSLLTPLTPPSMMSPSALTSLTSPNALASLGTQHSSASTTPSKSKSSNAGGSSRSRSSNKNSNSGRNSSSSWLSNSSRNSSQHSLPLLYTLKSGMMTPEVAKEVYEQLKLNPHLASLPGFDSLHNLSSLNSSASLQSLANLHNLSNLQSFPTLFPFLAPTSVENSLVGNVGSLCSSSIGKDSHTSPGGPLGELSLTTNSISTETANDMNSSIVPSEDQGALNLSSTAVTCKSESPKLTTAEESDASTVAQNNTADQNSDVIGAGIDGDDEMNSTGQPPAISEISTRCPTPVSQNTPDIAQEAGHHEGDSNIPNGCVTSDLSHTGSNSIVSNNIDSGSLPLLLMTSGASLAGMTQPQTDLSTVTDTSVDTHCASQQVRIIVVNLNFCCDFT